MIAKETMETFGVVCLAILTCLLALALIIGFLFLPVKSAGHHPANQQDFPATAAHGINLAN